MKLYKKKRFYYLRISVTVHIWLCCIYMYSSLNLIVSKYSYVPIYSILLLHKQIRGRGRNDLTQQPRSKWYFLILIHAMFVVEDTVYRRYLEKNRRFIKRAIHKLRWQDFLPPLPSFSLTNICCCIVDISLPPSPNQAYTISWFYVIC